MFYDFGNQIFEMRKNKKRPRPVTDVAAFFRIGVRDGGALTKRPRLTGPLGFETTICINVVEKKGPLKKSGPVQVIVTTRIN